MKKRPGATKAESHLHSAIRELEKFHAMGLESRTKHPDRMPYGKMVKLTPHQREQLRKARVFACGETGYTKSELNELIAQCRREGFVLRPFHIIRLLAVPKKGGKRGKLQLQAIQNQWSWRRLNAEIRHLQGIKSPPGAGRNAARPRDSVEALHRMISLCSQWLSLSEALEDDPQDYFPDSLLPDNLRERMKRVTSLLQKLSGEADQQLSKSGR